MTGSWLPDPNGRKFATAGSKSRERRTLLFPFLAGASILLAISCTALFRGPEQPFHTLRVASFRCDATPPLGEPLIWAEPLREVLSPLLAKGIVLEDGPERFVLCALDWCELNNDSDLALRKALAEAAGTEVSHVVIQCVHQHAAPYADIGAHRLLKKAPDAPLCLSDGFLEDLTCRLAGAVRDATDRLEPFNQVGTGKAEVQRVASSRRIPGPDGKIIVRYSAGGKDPRLAKLPEGFIDPFLRTITLARDGTPLVRLHFYATHPQTFCCDGRASSDFVGEAREELERREGVFQVYFTGCAGDITVGKYNDGTERARRELSRRLLKGMEKAAAATTYEPAERVAWRSVPLYLPLRTDPGFSPKDWRADLLDPRNGIGARVYRGAMALAFAARIKRPLPAASLRIGRACMVFLPGEPMVEFQLFAQKIRPEAFVAVAGYGDCGPGYICTDRAYAEGGYEPTATNVAVGSEAALKNALVKLLAVEAGKGGPHVRAE